jgi:hypothetical protein
MEIVANGRGREARRSDAVRSTGATPAFRHQRSPTKHRLMKTAIDDPELPLSSRAGT